MKIVCDCGNQDIFNTIDEDGNETEFTDGEGQYATIEKFSFWETHDVVGLVCDVCKKSVWIFT